MFSERQNRLEISPYSGHMVINSFNGTPLKPRFASFSSAAFAFSFPTYTDKARGPDRSSTTITRCWQCSRRFWASCSTKDKEAQHLACLQSHPCPEISENLVFEWQSLRSQVFVNSRHMFIFATETLELLKRTCSDFLASLRWGVRAFCCACASPTIMPQARRPNAVDIWVTKVGNRFQLCITSGRSTHLLSCLQDGVPCRKVNHRV